MKKIRVLFVCLGNICRSPMGEFIFKDMVKRCGYKNLFEIASAGTSSEEAGNPVYPPARAELAKHGISCLGKYAVKYFPTDYNKYDYILAMEERHVRSVCRISPDTEKKVFRLRDFCKQPSDIADPWYTGDFKTAYAEIEEGCSEFLKWLKKKGVIE